MITMPNDDEIYHYASKYYDPIKAHEYYMQRRVLKGRASGVKNSNLSSSSFQNPISGNKLTVTEAQREEMKARAEEMRKEILESISKRIKRLSDEDKKRVGDEIKKLINEAKEEYNINKTR